MPAPATPTAKAVPPAYPVCRLADVASFSPGVWNGKPHDKKFIEQLAANFAKYSTGPNPYYQPYVSLNHKDELRGGFVGAARVSADSVLHLDAENVPEPVGAWRNAGGLTQPSIEYFEPVYDDAGKLVDGFRRPDGSIEPGPVLKCLTLLGNDAPANKGLPDLPFATYSHHHPRHRAEGGRVRRFSNDPNLGATMDRAAMIAALTAAGIDMTSVTDAVPDEFLKAVLDMMQKSATPADLPAAPAPEMADAFAGVGAAPAIPAAPAPAASGIPGIGTAQPSSVVLKFKDTTPAGIAQGMADFQATVNAQVQSILATATANMAAVNRAAAQQAHAAKFNDVTAFVASLGKPDAKGNVRIQPAQKVAITALLMKCDGTRVRKFADGKRDGSELDEMKANLSATLPFLKFSEKMPDGSGAGVVTPGGRGTAGGGIDPERRARMLSATPQGRALLALEAKK